MANLGEAYTQQETPLNAALRAGLENLDLNQIVTFNLYNRVVLPADGFVFWVKQTTGSNITFNVAGSLHYATTNTQEAEANQSNNRVVFTAEQEVNALTNVSPSQMWVAEYSPNSVPPVPLKIAFSSRGSFYQQANLYHYVGVALLADMQTQLIDNPADVPSALIVSNSLPIWLLLSNYTPTNPAYGFSNPFALYPSFLVPNNLDPTGSPYGAVDILPEQTFGLQGAPFINQSQSHFQLAHDTVRITLYGGTNAQALQFVDCVNQYSLDYDTIGMMNIPIPQDAKKTQAEFMVIGMKKVITYEVSYIQKNIEAVAQKLITSVVNNYFPQTV